MEAGDLEIKKAFEDTITKNIKTVIAYTTETRDLLRKIEEKITTQRKALLVANESINSLRLQLVQVQAKLYSIGE